MDPVTHTFTGAALSDAGLRKATPLATAALVVAANIPDVDIVTLARGDYFMLAHRRGWTHGLPAMLLWPFVVTALFLLYDRLWRRRRNPAAAPVRAGPLLAVSALGVLTHPALDWLNTYGMRWLMPFSGEWTYGDAVFIVDPWLWLALGGALFLRFSSDRWSAVGWALFWGGATALVMTAPMVPTAARVVWGLWLGLLVVRRLGLRGSNRAPGTGTARAAVAAAAVYIGLMVVADRTMTEAVRSQAQARGLEVVDVMVAPEPANPLSATFLVELPASFEEGLVRVPWSPEVIPARGRMSKRTFGSGVSGAAGDAAIEAARKDPRVRDYLAWSRYPYWQVDRRGSAYRVRVGDARYTGRVGAGSLRGLAVDVPASDP